MSATGSQGATPGHRDAGLALQSRLVRYRDLRPCTTAFVDTRTPGSDRKENFAIIGPGVAENPDQHVHLRIPHGYNIGAARQPPRCVNSQHSHETAEVFIVHSGRWRMTSGHDANDGHVELERGDVVSFPTRMFRGFENVGDDAGFLFAVLGGDDPGRVTWAPYVFDAADRAGLVLLESGRLIDTHREPVPQGARLMRRTTMADVARLARVDSAGLESVVFRGSQRRADLLAMLEGTGVVECPIIAGDRLRGSGADGQLPFTAAHGRSSTATQEWRHGFALSWILVAPGAETQSQYVERPAVLLGHDGDLAVDVDGTRLTLSAGDTLSLPVGSRYVATAVGTCSWIRSSSRG